MTSAMHLSRRHFIATAPVALAAFTGVTLAVGNPLDGRVFVADAGVRGKPADEKGDVITFADGSFHSRSCDQWGYGKGEVRVSGSGDALVFEVETLSPKDGRLQWQGTVVGNSIEGTFTHLRKPSTLRPNPEPVVHWFKGSAKT